MEARRQAVTAMFGAVFAVLALSSAACAQSPIVDRIVAVVDNKVLLESDLDTAIRFEALAESKPLASVTPAERKAALDRLIDQALLAERMESVNFTPASRDEIAARLKEVRTQLGAAAASDAAWESLLAAYDLSDDEVSSRIETQLNELRFVNVRLRPGVRVDQAHIEAYYKDKFVPEIRKTGAPAPAIGQVSARIEEILIEERIGEMLGAWLKGLRATAHIRLLDPGNQLTPPTAQTAGSSAGPTTSSELKEYR